MSQHRSLFGPLLLIAAGAIWLLIASGQVPAENLWALTYIWPYFLIAAGIGLLLRGYWQYTSILTDVAVIGGTVAAILFAPALGWDNPSIPVAFFEDGLHFGPSRPGSGNVVTATRDVATFEAVEIDYPAQVFISQGRTESLKIEAEDNLLPGLRTEVRDGKLRIYYRVTEGPRVNPSEPVRITIVVSDLSRVELDSAGDLTITELETDTLDVSISGAGLLRLDDIQTRNLSVNLSGAGSMSASGTTDELGVVISGFGSFTARDLHSQTAEVDLSGAGSATVWVEDRLDATISGAGSVNYYGSPEVTRQVSGVGTVSKSGDK